MRNTFLLLLSLLAGMLTTKAQEPIQKILPDALKKQQQENPEEKIYMQLDKDIYLHGEQIWLKLYLVDAYLHQPSFISSVAYVELINAQDSLIVRHTLDVTDGGAPGDILIPKDLSPGTYYLRAYTQWMRNFGTSFQTSIQILNKEKEEIAPARWRVRQTPDVQFLPEGGHLIGGLTSKVGIKVVGSDGLGRSAEGEILDKDGKVVSSFQTEYKGMGVFSFTPQANDQYTAKVRVEAWEEEIVVKLPKAETKGYVMEAKASAMFNEINVQASQDLADAEFVLLAQVRGQIVSLVRAKLKGQVYQVSIPNYKIPEGVMTLSLFDPEGKLRAERLIYVRGKDFLKLDLQTNKTRYKNREAVEVQLSAKDPKGNPVAGWFSVSVADIAAYWESPDRSNIMSQYLLASELQGFVEEPNYYFSGSSATIDKHLDLLLLTQGWRKIDWEAVIAGEYQDPTYLIEQGLMITGSAVTATNKQAPEGTLISLTIDNIFNTYSSEVDAEGKFAFAGLGFADTSRLILQGRTKRNKAKYFGLTLDTIPPRKIERYPYFEMEVVDPLKSDEYISQMERQIEAEAIRDGEYVISIDEVEITGKREEDHQQSLTDGGLYREPSYRLMGEDAPPNFNVFDAIRGRAPGVQVSGNIGAYSVTMRGGIGLNGIVEAAYILDGTFVDASVLEAIQMSQIERIDILKGAQAAGYGMRGGGGVVAVYTKDGYVPGGDATERLGVLKTQWPGFHAVRTFYSPDYSTEQESHALPDLRTTLYWNPLVQTDSTGQAKLRFYTADTDGAYLITVEGLNGQGYLGHKEEQIEVLD
ncbi:MAG: TonB-dependent receptor plug domain-containing protein [Bacteroidota bacterium]